MKNYLDISHYLSLHERHGTVASTPIVTNGGKEVSTNTIVGQFLYHSSTPSFYISPFLSWVSTHTLG